jgi:hypothetical protein
VNSAADIIRRYGAEWEDALAAKKKILGADAAARIDEPSRSARQGREWRYRWWKST